MMSSVISVVVGATLLAIVSVVLVIKTMLYICQPNEVLIFSGTPRRRADGKGLVGYRIIKGGRGLRIPLFERVDRMDLSNMAIDVIVRGAFSRGGIPLTVQAVANVKISGSEPTLNNAIERFLGRPREEIQRIAQETLEGNLRGVLATLTPEQVNEDKISFGESLQAEADQDLRKLGLELDMMKVQNVSDDVGYLNSIGRKQSAEVKKRALIAEAQSESEARIRNAENLRHTELARIDAEIAAVKADMERRIVDARTMAPALVAEQESVVKTAMAKTTAELDVQLARVEQVRRQLEADVVEPAKAEQQRAEEEARGQAASIVEDGAALGKTLQEMAAAWKHAGEHARDVFLWQKLNSVMKTVMSTIDDVHVEQLTVLGDRPGAAMHSLQNGEQGFAPAKLLSASEQLKATLGVDVVEMVKAMSDRLRHSAPSAPSMPSP